LLLTNIAQVIKSRKIKWVGLGAHMGERRCACSIWWEKMSLARPRHRLKGNINVSKKNLLGEGVWTGLVWLGIEKSGGLLCMQE
jgi:hypothetical protein